LVNLLAAAGFIRLGLVLGSALTWALIPVKSLVLPYYGALIPVKSLVLPYCGALIPVKSVALVVTYTVKTCSFGCYAEEYSKRNCFQKLFQLYYYTHVKIGNWRNTIVVQPIKCGHVLKKGTTFLLFIFQEALVENRRIAWSKKTPACPVSQLHWELINLQSMV